MKDTIKNDIYWMQLALIEAEKAMDFTEIPVATILVGGDEEITRSQTMVRRKNSITAHGELFALLEAQEKIWTCKRPLTIYTTLEPCLMCLGASIQAGVDRIVYAMKAAPDGGAKFKTDIEKGGQNAPEIVSGLLENQSVELFRKFLIRYPQSPATPYVEAMLVPYS